MIGIFGGTFDPIHIGHLRLALEVVETCQLQQLRLLPNRVPPHRPQPRATPEQRLNMLALAVEKEPSLVVDGRELGLSGASYTVHTLADFKREYPLETLILVIGQDSFLHFRHWFEWERILQLAHLVVIQRPGYAMEVDPWYVERLITTPIPLQQTQAGHIWLLPQTGLDISATAIRKRLANGQNVRYLLPDAVLDYLLSQAIYERC